MKNWEVMPFVLFFAINLKHYLAATGRNILIKVQGRLYYGGNTSGLSLTARDSHSSRILTITAAGGHSDGDRNVRLHCNRSGGIRCTRDARRKSQNETARSSCVRGARRDFDGVRGGGAVSGRFRTRVVADGRGGGGGRRCLRIRRRESRAWTAARSCVDLGSHCRDSELSMTAMMTTMMLVLVLLDRFLVVRSVACAQCRLCI